MQGGRILQAAAPHSSSGTGANLTGCASCLRDGFAVAAGKPLSLTDHPAQHTLAVDLLPFAALQYDSLAVRCSPGWRVCWLETLPASIQGNEPNPLPKVLLFATAQPAHGT